MPDPHELEGKFACEPEDLERVLTLEAIGDFRRTSQDERTQTDVYYDTETLALRARSCSLRLRQSGDKLKATFKGPRQAVDSAEDASHLIKRVEIEVAVTPRPEGTRHPAAGDESPFTERTDLEPVSRAREIAGDGNTLQPLARMETHRRTLRYQRGDGETVELALDRVAACDLRNGRQTDIVEIEIELVDGSEATLISAATALRAAVPTLRPSARSKLARALGE